MLWQEARNKKGKNTIYKNIIPATKKGRDKKDKLDNKYLWHQSFRASDKRILLCDFGARLFLPVISDFMVLEIRMKLQSTTSERRKWGSGSLCVYHALNFFQKISDHMSLSMSLNLKARLP